MVRSHGRLEAIVKARRHASSLPCAKQLGQLSGPRAVRIHRRRDATIRLGRAGAERRVHQHERQRAGDDRFEHFATARPERGTTAQEERHVHSERGGHFGEPGRRPPEAPQTVEAEEHGGGITRSTPQTSRHRDPLVERDVHTTIDLRRLPQGRGGTQRQVRRVAGDSVGVHGQPEPGCLVEDQAIGEVDGLHHGRELVIAVGTLASNLEDQVDLGRGAEHEATTPRSLRQGRED
ncbi:MAG: hypothetical protein AUG14_02905 [Candidatus Rokubacteria bacterium 13_1_20CM_2_68_19]|nr:MAG: hypothetical protein AUG14_02905 [Candidatus Rokubacteria bacterium 13_1_20CM_2_68_19]